MVRFPLVVLLIALSLTGQVSRNRAVSANNPLRDSLSGLKNLKFYSSETAQKLTNEMAAMSDPSRHPSLGVLNQFSSQLVEALAGRSVSDSQLETMESCIREVMSGNVATLTSASRMREVLREAGVETTRLQMVVRRLIAIGEEVRGPDDMKISPRVQK